MNLNRASLLGGVAAYRKFPYGKVHQRASTNDITQQLKLSLQFFQRFLTS